jgi:alpha-glucosidase (family GH31 glycosyl hydrolase)
MQFSIPPWHYNNISKIKVNEICQNLVEIHSNIVYPVLMKEIYNTISYGSPLIRPLWWLNNSDQITLTIDDEFLVGNDILVAPILKENSYQRDIYLPKGYFYNYF